MKFGIAQKQGYIQVDLEGVMADGAVTVLREEIDHLISTNPLRVLWNLSKLTQMAPEVFCEMLRALARVRLAGGTSVLFAPPEDVRKYLSQLVLDGLVPSTSEPQAALRMLMPQAAPRRSEFVEVSLLGEILIDLGVLDEVGLKRALDEQRSVQGKEKLGSILLRLNIVTPAQILSALETQYKRRLQKSGQPASPPTRSAFAPRKHLGEILQEIGVVDAGGLKRALEEQQRAGNREKLGDVLLRLNIVTPDQLLRALETQARL